VTVSMKAPAAKWKTMFNVLRLEVEEPVFDFNPEGFHVYAMGADHRAALQFMFPSEAFESYAVTEAEHNAYRVADLVKILTKSGVSDSFAMETDPTGQVHVTIGGDYVSRFNLHSFDPSLRPDKRIVKDSEDVGFSMSKADLVGVLEKTGIVSENFTISSDAEGTTFIAKGENIARAEVFLRKDQFPIYNVKTESRAKYNGERLLAILKALGEHEQPFNLRFGTRYPVTMETLMDDKGSKFLYFQAPYDEADK
jgi:DNA polymerase III sliding clamp (beta) subunit (PCNA family)